MKNIRELYSSIEEYNPIVLDKFGRFPSYLSSNAKKMEPILSQYLFDHGFKPQYKNGKKYAVCFTHDVDYIFDHLNGLSASKSLAKSLIKLNFKKTAYDFNGIFSPQINTNWSLDRIIDTEIENNIKSSYYFLAINRNEEDYNYSLESMKPYFKKIKNAGSEIGLHGGHKAYNNVEKIDAEKNKLEKESGETLKGYRNHYLRFKTPNTWNHLEALKFTYDTTYGFADLVGFRNGLCYPFRPFDFKANRYLDILEIPLIIMDVSFWKYMALNIDESFTLFKNIASAVKNINGVLTILWHNHSMIDKEAILYERIIKYLVRDEEAWFTNSLELAEHWKENNLSAMESILNKYFDQDIQSLY